MQTVTEAKKENSPDLILPSPGEERILSTDDTTDPNVSKGNVYLRYQQKHEVSIKNCCHDTLELLTLLPSPLFKLKTAPDQMPDCLQLHGSSRILYSLAHCLSPAHSHSAKQWLHAHYRTLSPSNLCYLFLKSKFTSQQKWQPNCQAIHSPKCGLYREILCVAEFTSRYLWVIWQDQKCNVMASKCHNCFPRDFLVHIAPQITVLLFWSTWWPIFPQPSVWDTGYFLLF